MKTVAWILTVWGGIGVLNQIMTVSATQGSVVPTAALNNFDPAKILGVAASSPPSYTSPAMLTDAAILGVGLFLHSRGKAVV